MYSIDFIGNITRDSDGATIPIDANNIDYQAYLAWIAAGNTPQPYEPDPVDVLVSYEAAIEARLDQFAQSRGYRHGDRLASYTGSKNATWAAEADRFIALRDQTWTKFIAISDDIKAGKRPMPTLDEILAELPALTWDANV